MAPNHLLFKLSPLAVDLELLMSTLSDMELTLSERAANRAFGKRAIEADPDCDSPDGVR